MRYPYKREENLDIRQRWLLAMSTEFAATMSLAAQAERDELIDNAE